MRYRLAIFDMDGTILYTLKDLMDSLNHSLICYGYPTRTAEAVRSFIGDGIRKLVERGLPPYVSEDQIDSAFDTFIDYYKEHCKDTTRPYDGIVELLYSLKNMGIKTAVVSNKADLSVRALTEQFFDGLFDYYVGEKVGTNKKPAPDMVNEVLKALDIPRENAVYIGDADTDILTARNAGMCCISVTWGYKDVDFLQKSGAQNLVHTPQELLHYFTND